MRIGVSSVAARNAAASATLRMLPPARVELARQKAEVHVVRDRRVRRAAASSRCARDIPRPEMEIR